MVEILVTEHQLSARHACRAVGLSRTAWHRRPADPAIRDGAVIAALLKLVAENTRWGFWKCFGSLRLADEPWNHKRVHRVYCALGLNLPRRTKRRVPTRERQPLITPSTLNTVWALDFMHDALYGGRPFRTLNVLDEANREVLAIEVGTSLPAARVIRVMEQLIEIYGRPAALRLDNGPEFTSQQFVTWCQAHGIELRYIQPGKPDQNAFIERFNRTYRDEILDAHVFEATSDVQWLTDDWLKKYNDHRPHDSLGRIPPTRFLPRPKTPSESNYAWRP